VSDGLSMHQNMFYVIALLLFWISVWALLHTYMIYPLIVRFLSARKEHTGPSYSEHELPTVSILIPAHNEEAVIGQKIASIFQSDYPEDKLEVIVGSDASIDRTDELVLSLSKSNLRIRLIRMNERGGKATVLNRITNAASGEILVLSDANVMFEKNTLYEMVKYFKDPNIGLIDTSMRHTGMKKSGISIPEKTYLRGEAALKHGEGLLWGVMMGPFGGCFAMRKSLYTDIPSNCLVDDFYLCMCVLQKGYRAISQPHAVVIEDISNDMRDEFRRKVRIATGNFQNLAFFYQVLLRLDTLSFAFFSHKILRWVGPLFLIVIGIFAAPLMKTNPANYVFGILVIIAVMLLIIDAFLRRMNVHFAATRLLTHFITTNVALLVGMIRFVDGVKTGAWTPTRRHQ